MESNKRFFIVHQIIISTLEVEIKFLEIINLSLSENSSDGKF